MTWSPLMTHKMENFQDRSSRGGRTIHSIGHHHTAGPSKDAALSAFLPGGREVTPNYFIWENEIWGIVDEDYRAWTSGSADGDGASITYEICNSTGGPAWLISETTKNTVARLDAEISKRRGIQRVEGFPGFWQHRNLYEWFGWGYATACAGPDFNTQDMIARTNRADSRKKDDMTTTYNYITDDDAKAALGAKTGDWWARDGASGVLMPITPGQASEAFAADGISDGPFNYGHLVKSRTGKWLLAAVAEDNANLTKGIAAHPLLGPGTGSGGGGTPIKVPTAEEIATEVIRQMKLPGN